MKIWIGAAAAMAMATGAACGAPQARDAASVQAQLVSTPSAALSPAQAIEAAAARPDDGAEGVFEFAVRSVGGGRSARSSVFLNSAADYHEADNLSVMIRPAAAREIEQALGGPLAERLDGKRISVRGVARRVQVDVYGENRRKTGESYFQTRIEVTRADQVVVG